MQAFGQRINGGDEMNEITFKVRFFHGKRDLVLVSLSDSHTLKALNDIIQEALGWDNCHLYEFIMEGKPYSPGCKSYPCKDEECETDDPSFLGFAEQTKISQLGLAPKQKFTYHFDYGDEHLFEVEAVEIKPAKKSTRAVIKRFGKMPLQYR
jgi:hypothetical protein